GAHEIALKYRKPAVEQRADQHQLSGLVGGENEAQAVGGQKVDEAARGRDGGLLLLLPLSLRGALRRRRRGLRRGHGSFRMTDALLSTMVLERVLAGLAPAACDA